MILSCPSCQARYLVPASHFAAGARMVRCARCTYIWFAEVPPEPAAAMAAQLSALTPTPQQPKPLAPGANLPVVPKHQKLLGWSEWITAGVALTIAVVLLTLAVERQEITATWPSTAQYYDRVGLHVYHVGEGLSLRQVRSEMRYDGGITQLMVEGQVHNDTDKPQPIPNILAAAIAPDGKTMESWQIDAPAATLGPGESVPFTSAIHAPKGSVTEISLHFIEPKHAS